MKNSTVIALGIALPFQGVAVVIGGVTYYTSEFYAKYINESDDFYID